MLRVRCSSQARATCIGVAPRLLATSDSAVDCNGVNRRLSLLTGLRQECLQAVADEGSRDSADKSHSPPHQ
jgi:hypothetical protein